MTSPLVEVASYYSQKLAEHGQTARGVDWNGEESQTLRFEQLTRLIDGQKAFSLQDGFSVNDLGCGYGAMLDYLGERFDRLHYFGQDISADMVAAAKRRFTDRKTVCFQQTDRPPQTADFGFASGIFNVRLSTDNAAWRDYIETTLDVMNETSRHGFAFNCLTSYSDADRMRGNLYYASPGAMFDLCKSKYSRNVALLHDYDLYEFTILVRKS